MHSIIHTEQNFTNKLNIEELRDHCLQKPGVTEGLPFGEDTLVFKVGEKMFLLISIKLGNSFNVKCDPELAVELREPAHIKWCIGQFDLLGACYANFTQCNPGCSPGRDLADHGSHV